MPTATAFGRRGASSAPVSPRPAAPRQQPVPRAPPTPRAEPPPADALSPAAEAFRAELAAHRGKQPRDFAGWRRSTSWESWLMLGVRVLAFAPGIITHFMDAPLEVSGGLEVAAVVGNVWYRMTRRRRMREVVAWQDPRDGS